MGKVDNAKGDSKSLIARWQASGLERYRFETAFSSGKGMYIKDVEGNKYLDFASSMCHVGHSHPKIVNSVVRQARRSGAEGFRFGFNELRVLLAEKLKQISPLDLETGKVAFTNTGSDATENAMKLARAYTRKQILFAYMGSHHGYSIGALSLTADFSFRRRHCLPLIPGVVHVPYPYCYRCPFEQAYPGCRLSCLEHVQYVLDTVAHPDEVAAVFFEPVLQMGGVVVPPKEYVLRLRKMCDEYGILLVDDEVYTGFGKTGKMFAIEHFGVTPDIMYMGKGIASGLSLAAIIAKKEIVDAEEKLDMVHGGAFAGNLLSCAASLATIEVIEEEKLVENSQKIGSYMIKRLKEMAEKNKLIGDVRGLGLLIGIELVRDQKKPARNEAEQAVIRAFKRGLLIGNLGMYKNVVRIIPPLVVTKEQAEKALEVLEEEFGELAKNRLPIS